MKTLFRLCATIFITGTSISVSMAALLQQLPNEQAALAAPADAQNFRFVVGGDNRASSHGAPMPPVFASICREIGLLRPDFVLWTGDSIEGYDDTPSEAAAEYDTFLQTVSLCRAPVFNAPGNHEMGKNPDLQPVYQQKMGALYGAFDYGNSHFIALDTSPVINGTVHDGELDETQLQWLEDDLQAHQNSSNIFIFAHHYVFGPPDPDKPEAGDTGLADRAFRDRLHALFVRSKVRAVFCGHAHLYWHQAKDGVDYFIAGNAGAPMEAAPEEGGFPGYLLVNVAGDKISTQVLQPAMTLPRLRRGGDGKAESAELAIDEYNHFDFAARGIEIEMPAKQNYTVNASTFYKGKTRPVAVSIAREIPALDGQTVTLILAAELPHSRTTTIVVQATPR